jgi:hypothetical protein
VVTAQRFAKQHIALQHYMLSACALLPLLSLPIMHERIHLWAGYQQSNIQQMQVLMTDHVAALSA